MDLTKAHMMIFRFIHPCRKLLVGALPPSALIWGHLLARQPIRWLDTSARDMARARARPWTSVRGTTGWTVTELKNGRRETIKTNQKKSTENNRGQRSDRKRRRKRRSDPQSKERG